MNLLVRHQDDLRAYISTLMHNCLFRVHGRTLHFFSESFPRRFCTYCSRRRSTSFIPKAGGRRWAKRQSTLAPIYRAYCWSSLSYPIFIRTSKEARTSTGYRASSDTTTPFASFSPLCRRIITVFPFTFS